MNLVPELPRGSPLSSRWQQGISSISLCLLHRDLWVHHTVYVILVNLVLSTNGAVVIRGCLSFWVRLGKQSWSTAIVPIYHHTPTYWFWLKFCTWTSFVAIFGLCYLSTEQQRLQSYSWTLPYTSCLHQSMTIMPVHTMDTTNYSKCHYRPLHGMTWIQTYCMFLPVKWHRLHFDVLRIIV